MKCLRGCKVSLIGIYAWVGTAMAVDIGADKKGCAVSDADFAVESLVTGESQPIKLAFNDRGGAVDVYFTRKTGEIRKYDATTKAVVAIGKIGVATGNEDGLIGIALDPNFKTNNFAYVYYSYNGSNESTYRISRFTITSDKLDMGSEKVLIRANSVRGRWHTAGAMNFDDYGDLWVAMGDNEQTETGPSNTSDLRGGIIRIHPDNSARGYSIPKGNFGEAMAKRFRTAGNEALAAQYEDTTKVKPEIYIKGTRNSYTFNLDPARRYFFNGDVGPDQGKVSEEHNFTKQPEYLGWPYFAGDEALGEMSPAIKPYGISPAIPKGINKSAPKNNSGSGGVVDLPAIVDPILKRNTNCSMAGPYFRYDGRIASSANFPPVFNGKWLISDCNGNYGWHLFDVDTSGNKLSNDKKIWSTFTTGQVVDIKQGPDGAVYYVNHSGSTIRKISYTGSCKDATMIPESGSTTALRPSLVHADAGKYMNWQSRILEIKTAGRHDVYINDLQGRAVLHLKGNGPMSHSLSALDRDGLYVVHLDAGEINLTQTLLFTGAN